MEPRVEELDVENVRSLSGNDKCVYVTTQQGDVYCRLESHSHTAPWQKCSELEAKDISDVSSGRHHHIGLTGCGQVFTWRDKECDDPGEMHRSLTTPGPKLQPLVLSHKIVQVACGEEHTVCLTKTGLVGVWGSNSEGQLGLGSHARCYYDEPQFIHCLKGVPFVQVAAGGYHTLALTGSGAVFGWGRNSSGQLGFKGKERQMLPTLCKNVRSKMITFVSCGENHTAMLSKTGCVFAFGLEFEKYWNETSHPSAESDGRIANLNGKNVSAVVCDRQNIVAFVAGSDQIFIYGNRQTNVKLVDVVRQNDADHERLDAPFCHDLALFPSFNSAFVQFCKAPSQDAANKVMDRMLRLDGIKTKISRGSWPDQEELKLSFSSASCINGSFLSSDFKHQECSRLNGHGIDFKEVETFFELLNQESCKDRSVSIAVTDALKDLMSTLPDEPGHVEALRLYLILPFCHHKEEAIMGQTVIGSFIASFRSLNKNCQNILDQWLKEIALKYFKRYLQTFGGHFCKLLSKFQVTCVKGKVIPASLQSCLWLLEKLYTVNEKRAVKVAYEEFYEPKLWSLVNLQDDFFASLRDNERGRDTCRFCNFPFLFNPEGKSHLLRMQNRIEMIDADISVRLRLWPTIALGFRDMLPYFLRPDVVQPLNVEDVTVDGKIIMAMNKELSPVFPLQFTRKNIVKETRQMLMALHLHDTSTDRELVRKMELAVSFIGEKAVGQGVYQEYFTVLFNELLDPNSGLFSVENESNLRWFKSQGPKGLELLYFVGFMLGLALHNNRLVNLQFPKAFYKKLLNVDVTFEDFEELKPLVAKHLLEVDLGKSGEELTFAEFVEKQGKVIVVELCEKGMNTDVTPENKQRYIDLKVDFLLNKSIEEEFRKFYDGFCDAFDMDALRKLQFQPADLKAAIVGEESIDFTALERRATYQDGYHAHHPVIDQFWKSLSDMSAKDKKLFARFLTGTERIPCGGLDIVIGLLKKEANAQYNDRLMPEVVTCGKMLLLPHISDPQRFKSNLLDAIRGAHGFASLYKNSC